MTRTKAGASFPLSEVPARLVDLGLGAVSLTTVHRWAGKGRHGVVLATTRVDGTPHTTTSALLAFIREAGLS